MDWVVWVLFDSVAALGVTLFLINYGLLVYWRRSGRARPLLAGLAVGVVLLVVQAQVMTQREHALAILTPIERDVLASRTDALSQSLARNFTAGSMDREGFVRFAREGLTTVTVERLHRESLHVENAESESFDAVVTYRAVVIAGDVYTGLFQSRWRIKFRLEDGQWRIAAIEVPEIDGLPVRGWADLRR